MTTLDIPSFAITEKEASVIFALEDWAVYTIAAYNRIAMSFDCKTIVVSASEYDVILNTLDKCSNNVEFCTTFDFDQSDVSGLFRKLEADKLARDKIANQLKNLFVGS